MFHVVHGVSIAQVVRAQGNYSTVRISSSRGHVKECYFFVFSMFYGRKLNMRVNRIDHVMEINKAFSFQLLVLQSLPYLSLRQTADDGTGGFIF